jgi:hypothetical protein
VLGMGCGALGQDRKKTAMIGNRVLLRSNLSIIWGFR